MVVSPEINLASYNDVIWDNAKEPLIEFAAILAVFVPWALVSKWRMRLLKA